MNNYIKVLISAFLITTIAGCGSDEITSHEKATVKHSERLAHIENSLTKFATWSLINIHDEVERGNTNIDSLGYRIIAIEQLLRDVKTDNIEITASRKRLERIIELVHDDEERRRLAYVIVHNVWFFEGDNAIKEKYGLIDP